MLDAVGVAGIGFTVMEIAFEVAGLPITPDKLEVITQVILFPFARVVEVYVELMAPEITEPFRYHWYVGVVPPLVGVAVKVTEDPAQLGFEPDVTAIETDATTAGSGSWNE